ncbi:MAG: SDR family NAD(P)-dependent oxidoreductase [Gammaproteobacteria bacterium]|jgi:NAD(P)-dependent dehydrogenase (short-subunit alcohol dehydrogenase family)|nr:SDR family NAD(P)-dependent oxidoreductase [Gammaproteobacteria bacterium]
MQTSNQKVIWVTGASSGLGRSIALQLANRGALVIASARNRQALDELAAQNANIRALACDITDAAECAALGAQIAAISPHIDQAILNAGNCEYLDFPDPDWAAVRRVMEVNFFGTVNCVELVLPLLRAARRPHLVVIASQATAAPFPRAEAYGASKAALQYFCACLRLDLACEKIDVSVVNPGFVDTPLTRKNDFEMPFLMDVEQAASRVIGKLASRPRRYSFPMRLSLLLGLSKLAPGLWQKAMTASKKSSTTPPGT